MSSCRCVADAHGAGGGDIEAEVDEQAAAVASAALAALSKARVHPSNKATKQQAQQHLQQQDTHADEPDQRVTARHKQQKQQGAAKQPKQQKQQQRQKSPGARKRKSAAAADSDGSNSDRDEGSSSDTDAGSVVSWAISYASSSDGSGSDGGSSGSSDGSDSEAEASQPCWGAAAGAQQLLEPGLAWASGACASAALELVPKPAILAAVGELVLRVEEEQCWQAAARQHGVKQVSRHCTWLQHCDGSWSCCALALHQRLRKDYCGVCPVLVRWVLRGVTDGGCHWLLVYAGTAHAWSSPAAEPLRSVQHRSLALSSHQQRSSRASSVPSARSGPGCCSRQLHAAVQAQHRRAAAAAV